MGAQLCWAGRSAPVGQSRFVLGMRLFVSYTPACTLAAHGRAAFARESKDWALLWAILVKLGSGALGLSRLS